VKGSVHEGESRSDMWQLQSNFSGRFWSLPQDTVRMSDYGSSRPWSCMKHGDNVMKWIEQAR